MQSEQIIQVEVAQIRDQCFVHFEVFNLGKQVQGSSRGCICALCCASSSEELF